MKKFDLFIAVGIVSVLLFAGTTRKVARPYGMVNGSPEIKSMTSLAFGPNGVLFIGDSQNATVFAIDTKDNKLVKEAKNFDLKNFDVKLAEVLGTTKDQISITDLAVHPASKKLYIAVKSADGTPVLLTLAANNEFKNVSLNNIDYSSIALNNAPSADAKDRRGRSLRISSISDLGYVNGKLLVSGLSNKEFSSAFRSISFPFSAKQEDESTLEMYHASHGRYETTSPVRTFSTTTIAGKDYVVASYTCTPLVLFAMDDLKPGATAKGRTIAEMGNQNTPSDMIWLTSRGQQFLLMANDNRPAAKVAYSDIEKFQGSLTEKVATTGGVNFTALPYQKVMQIDRLDERRAVVLQRRTSGEIDLWTADGNSL